MFTPHSPSPNRPARRGVVLILVLAMLSILALLGVTFATLTGQAKIGASYRERALYNPEPTTIFDFALDQIINDTQNPKSAIRGHGLLRDMYGNDGNKNGYFGKMPTPYGWPFYIVGGPSAVTTKTTGTLTQFTIPTNIPTSNNPMISFCPDLYGAYFGPATYTDPSTGNPLTYSGWTLRLQQWYLNANYIDSTHLCPGVRVLPVL
ncbi:MAG TPA: hypothetical protein VFT74_13630, partial [Isosphaeraceae bacterium]|nr:hypothetical protein [Isosphaeraceae bacterium]